MKDRDEPIRGFAQLSRLHRPLPFPKAPLLMADLPDGKQPSQSRRRFGAPKNWRATFLATLADTSNISAAAAAADISLSWVYKTLRDDAEFRRR
ncbi:hypothetical protein [Novosphingobium aquae]|uniref:DNA binding HTH domain-containing protein n=1 Tax=Novosphingobium aquae TaxID=3133435 RepID=A0ABU8SBK1_9SPHN